MWFCYLVHCHIELPDTASVAILGDCSTVRLQVAVGSFAIWCCKLGGQNILSSQLTAWLKSMDHSCSAQHHGPQNAPALGHLKSDDVCVLDMDGSTVAATCQSMHRAAAWRDPRLPSWRRSLHNCRMLHVWLAAGHSCADELTARRVLVPAAMLQVLYLRKMHTTPSTMLMTKMPTASGRRLAGSGRNCTISQLTCRQCRQIVLWLVMPSVGQGSASTNTAYRHEHQHRYYFRITFLPYATLP
jgi:hypothetical protein